MSKVELIKNGRVVRVDGRLADFLVKRNVGYLRRDMVAQAAPARPPQMEEVVRPLSNESGSPDRAQAAALKRAAKRQAKRAEDASE